MKNSIIILLLILLVNFFGCSKKEDSPDTKKSQDTKTQDTKTQDVKKEETHDKLPDFPPDIPVYPGSKIISADKGAIGPSATLQTTDKASLVGEFYKTEMKKNGYKPDENNDKMMKDDRGIITFQKDGKEYTIGYRYLEEKGKTTIDLSTRTLK